MSLQGTIKRYFLIVSYITRANRPSRNEIMKMLDAEGLHVSFRTFQRDIEDIRNEFAIEIKYDKAKNGYFIDKEASLNMEFILRFFELSISAQVMIDSFKDGVKTLKYISFDSSDHLTGVHWLRNLVLATRKQQVIKFDHTSFQTGVTRNYEVHPYLLKEYKQRWFLFGFVPFYNDYRIFGIERIQNLIIVDQYFHIPKNFNSAERFEHIIGISLLPYQEQPIQTIVISTTAEQGRYMKSLPWHPSFTTLVDNDDEFRFALTIMPNNEFIQLMLNYCNRITILQPQWLRNTVKEILLDSAAKY